MIEERVTPGISLYETMQEHIGRYKFALDYTKGKKVLDIACGTGYGTYMLAQSAYDVKGVDISQDAIDYAQAHYQVLNLEFICSDACRLPFDDNEFDVIISFETIEHIKNYEGFLQEGRRVLKDDGVFICSTPNVKVGGGIADNPYHVVEFSPVEFTDLLLKKCSLVSLYGQHDIDSLNNALSKVIVNIKRKFGIDKRIIPSKKIKYPVTHFKNGITKSAYMIAVCYGKGT